MLTHGVGIGVDLAYWNRAMRFGAGLVARRRFLPGTIYHAGGMRAAWAPLFIGADAERPVRLSQRMPAAARALSDPDADEPHDQPAVPVLQTFVAAVVDSLVRNANGAPEVAVPQVRRKETAFDSMHDGWLNGLQSADGAVHGAPEQLGQLRTQVTEWQRPIALTDSAPFQICFRLEEPPEPPGDEPEDAPNRRDGWYLRYLLPATAVWKTGRQRIPELELDGFNPRVFLLASLGQGSGLCAGVADSLQRKRPAGGKLGEGARTSS